MDRTIEASLIMLLMFFNLETNGQEVNYTQHWDEKKSIESNSKAPVMGWASWNNYGTAITEDIIKAQADAMIVTGLKEAGYSFINIDDGFFGGRDAQGNLKAHSERFPNGMKLLADYIHSKGLKAGIYSDAGLNTCASYWYNDTLGVGMGLYGNEERDLELFLKKWDFDFIKVDWCGGEWLGLDEQTSYTSIGKQIKNFKPGAIYNVCRWKFPGAWVTQIADSWRISGDISNDFESILEIIDLNAELWMYASRGHYNDMDMLQVGRGMSYEEDKAHFSMWCMMHSPILLGNDLTSMSKETFEIITNREIIALNQSSFVYQARRIADYGATEIWAKPLISTMSGEIAVALLNRSENNETITFSLKSIGLDAPQEYIVKDLWTKETYPKSTQGELTLDVAARGIVVLKIKGKSLPYNVFQYKDKE